jgi:plastocyanin
MRTSALAIAAVLLLTLGGCASDTLTTDQGSQTDTDVPSSSDEAEQTGTSDLEPVLTNEPAAGGPQMVLSAAGFSPSELTISSGDVVSFTAEDGMYSLIVNQLSGVTVTSSLPEYYQFNDAGKYYLTEDLTGNTATITVE